MISSHLVEASRVAFEDAPQVLAQGDGNIANFLWDGDRCRLVDFEDGDQAFEIANLVEHLSTWLQGVLVAEDLLQLLVLDPDDVERVLRARRVLAICSDDRPARPPRRSRRPQRRQLPTQRPRPRPRPNRRDRRTMTPQMVSIQLPTPDHFSGSGTVSVKDPGSSAASGLVDHGDGVLILNW